MVMKAWLVINNNGKVQRDLNIFVRRLAAEWQKSLYELQKDLNAILK